MRKVLVAMILGLSMAATPALAQQSPTPTQDRIIAKAYSMGKPHDLGKAMAGIAVQETRAGVLGPVGDVGNGFGKRSYGVMQIKLQTAQHVMRICPDLDRNRQTEEEVIADLIHDDYWNMQVALCYLRYLREDRTWRQTILAYNRGPSGSNGYDENSHPYVMNVVHHVTEGMVHEFLKEYKR